MASLVETHLTLQARVRAALARVVGAAWTGLPGHDRENVDEWLAAVLPLVEAAQRQSVALTDAYVARALDRPALGVDQAGLIGAAVRNGTSPEVVYRRPFVQMWSALARGVMFDDALEQGRERAVSAAETDVQLAHRAAYPAIAMQDERVRGWQRVTDGKACELCLIASTQRYRRGDLMPIHNHCGCGVRPITDPDAGSSINRDLYRTLRADGAMTRVTLQRQASGFRQRAEQNRGRAEHWRREAAKEDDPARRLRLESRAKEYDARAKRQDAEAVRSDERRAAGTVEVAVREHGELGPVLTRAQDHFQSLADF